jgi:hypothetical protein
MTSSSPGGDVTRLTEPQVHSLFNGLQPGEANIETNTIDSPEKE